MPDPEIRLKMITHVEAFGANVRTVKVSNRLETLGWSHHREVADLEPEEQRHWLAQAEAEEWSRTTLRHEIKKAHQEAPDALPDDK